MFVYADATACPRCRATLPPHATHCAACRAVLDDAAARDVFGALQQVDRLVARLDLRPLPVPAGVATGGAPMAAPPLAPPSQPAAPQPAPALPQAPAAPPTPAAPSIMSGLTVPKILLGLGALCLIVAALVFLVVAWTSLGVGGRTAVLVGFTLTAAGLAAWSARSGLRAGAEALASVGFGLLVLDLAGARTSGWFGDLSAYGFALLTGGALMLVGAGANILTRRTKEPRLLSTEIATSLGILSFAGGLGAPESLTFPTWLTACLAVAIVLTLVTHALRLGIATWTAAGLAALAWSGLALVGLLRLAETPSWASLVADGRGWPLAVAAVVVAVPVLVQSLALALRVTALAVATALATAGIAAPVIDEGAEAVALVVAAVAAAHSALVFALRRPWSFVAVAPLLVSAAGLGVFLVVATLQAVAGLLDHGLWTGTTLTPFVAPSLEPVWALLLPLCTAAAGASALALTRLLGLPLRPVAHGAAAALVGSAALAPVLYGVPALVAVGALLVAALLLAGWALTRRDLVAASVAVPLAALALGAALVDDGLTIAVLALATVALAAGHVERSPAPVRIVAEWALPLAAAATTWAVASAADLAGEWRGVPVIAVTGALALAWAKVGHEVAGLAAALVALLVSVGFAPEAHELQAGQLAALAVLSTVVGVWRRPVAGLVGLGLFALASAASWPDPLTATVVLALATAAALTLELRGTNDAATAARAATPVALGALLWSAGDLAGLATVWQGVPVVLVLGALMIWRPDPLREVPAALVAVWAAACAIASQVDPQAWMAAYLTLGGVALTLSALLHPTRRRLAWGGLALLTAATWLRLEQIGVDTVEAYTLPLATVLLVVGTLALVRGERSSLQTQGAGLGLALVPSLLQTLAEPVALRAVLLGIGCILLIGVGVTQRWAAPLLAGGGTLAILVLREVTIAQQLPQWALIGLAGVTLTFVGLTWEKRLADVRAAAGYVRDLR